MTNLGYIARDFRPVLPLGAFPFADLQPHSMRKQGPLPGRVEEKGSALNQRREPWLWDSHEPENANDTDD